MKLHFKDFILSVASEFDYLKKRIISEDSKVVPIEIAKVGTYAGYSDGEFSLTEEVFEEVIRNFNREENPLPVYRGHADVVASETGATEEPPAVGWILGLTQEDGKLFAAVELTQEIEEQIKAGNYKFTSIYMRGDETDRNTGETIGNRLVSLALTNQPFILGCSEIQLSNYKNSKNIYMTKESLMAKKLSKVKANEIEEALEAEQAVEDMTENKVMQEEDTMLKKNLSEMEEKKEDESVIASELAILEEAKAALAPDMSMEDFIKSLLAPLMVEDEVEASEMEEAVEKVEASIALSATRRLNLALSAVKKENASLKKELSAAKEIILTNEINEYVKKGVILRSEQEDYVELAKSNRGLFDRMISKKAGNKVLSRVTTAKENDKRVDVVISDRDRKILEAYEARKRK